MGLVSFSNSAQALTVSPVKIEITGNPGEVIVEDTILINETDNTEVLYSSYSNFEAQGESGSPAFIEPKEGLGTWMSAPESVTLKPGETKIVPVRITIPSNAEAGGHFAVVFWGSTSPKEKRTSVGVGAKTGILMLLRVNGDISEEGGILEFGTVNNQRFYTSLPVNFYYRFQNSGGDRIKPEGKVVIKNMLTFVSARIPGNPVEGNVLPSSTRKFQTAWKGDSGSTNPEDLEDGNFFTKVGREWNNFGFGHYTAKIALAYGNKNQVSEGSVGFWVFPWHLTLFVVVSALILYYVLRKLIRRYNKWVILKAEEMLKKEQEKEKPRKIK